MTGRIATVSRLSPYVAELFLPGAANPFREQIAGRELLELPPASVVLGRSRL